MRFFGDGMTEVDDLGCLWLALGYSMRVAWLAGYGASYGTSSVPGYEYGFRYYERMDRYAHMIPRCSYVS